LTPSQFFILILLLSIFFFCDTVLMKLDLFARFNRSRCLFLATWKRLVSAVVGAKISQNQAKSAKIGQSARSNHPKPAQSAKIEIASPLQRFTT
jgi:hypothetical protein